MSPEFAGENSGDVRILEIHAGQPPFAVQAAVVSSGNEVIITAGDGQAEERAVAITSAQSTGRIGLLMETGSPADELARQSAFWLSKQLNANVTVCLGLPYQGRTAEESELITASYRRLVREICAVLGGQNNREDFPLV